MKGAVKNDILLMKDKTAAQRQTQTATQRSGCDLEVRSSFNERDELYDEMKKLVASEISLATSWAGRLKSIFLNIEKNAARRAAHQL